MSDSLAQTHAAGQRFHLDVGPVGHNKSVLAGPSWVVIRRRANLSFITAHVNSSGISVNPARSRFHSSYAGNQTNDRPVVIEPGRLTRRLGRRTLSPRGSGVYSRAQQVRFL